MPFLGIQRRIFDNGSREEGGIPQKRPGWVATPSTYPIMTLPWAAFMDARDATSYITDVNGDIKEWRSRVRSPFTNLGGNPYNPPFQFRLYGAGVGISNPSIGGGTANPSATTHFSFDGTGKYFRSGSRLNATIGWFYGFYTSTAGVGGDEGLWTATAGGFDFVQANPSQVPSAVGGAHGDGVNDYLISGATLSDAFDATGGSGCLTVAFLADSILSSPGILGTPTAQAPYNAPAIFADAAGFLTLAIVDDGAGPVLVAGAYDGVSRSGNDGWQMVTTPVTAGVFCVAQVRWTSGNTTLEIRVATEAGGIGAWQSCPFSALTTVTGQCMLFSNYSGAQFFHGSIYNTATYSYLGDTDADDQLRWIAANSGFRINEAQLYDAWVPLGGTVLSGGPTPGWTVFTVGRANNRTTTTQGYLSQGFWSMSSWYMGMGSTTQGGTAKWTGWAFEGAGVTDYNVNQSVTDDTWALATMQYSSPKLRMRLNGVESSDVYNTLSADSTSYLQYMTLGYNPGSGLYLSGALSFWGAAASNGWSDSRMRDVEAYLKSQFLTATSTNYPRSIGENVAKPTDANTRQFVGFRTMNESIVKPTDANTRMAAYARNIADSILKPTDGNNRALVLARPISESILKPTDANGRALVLARALAESIGAPTDANARSVGFVRGVSESIGAPTDANARAAGYTRNIAENVVKPTDANSRAQVLARSIAENVVKPTDANARAQVLARNIAENVVKPTDANLRVVGFTRTQVENVGAPTDANARAQVLTRAIAENVVKPTDANTRSQVLSRTQTENVPAPTDANTRAVGVTRNIADSIGAPTDAVSRVVGFVRNIAESIGAPTDANARVQVLTRQIAENVVKPTDAVARVYGALRNIVENVVKPTDANTRAFVGFRTQNENVPAPTDANTRSVGFFRSLNESIGAPTDANTRVGVFARNIGENIPIPFDTVSRVVSGHNDFFRDIPESIGAPTDANTRAVGQTRNIAESILKPTDAVSRFVSFVRNIAESILKPTDVNTRAVSFTRVQTESILLPTDLVTRSVVYSRFITENVAKPTDANTRGFARTVNISESIPAPTDTVQRTANFTRILLENVPAPTDVVVRAAYFSREIVETIAAPTDAVISIIVPAPSPGIITFRDQPFAQFLFKRGPLATISFNDHGYATILFIVDVFGTIETIDAPYAQIITRTPTDMNQDKYNVGDTAEIFADFVVTRTKTLTDPTGLEILVTPPSGTPYTLVYPCPEIVRDSVGKFRALIDVTVSGTWSTYWTATGAVKAAKRIYFNAEV